MLVLFYNVKEMKSLKQHITPKQAKEINSYQFYKLFDDIVPREDWYKYHHRKVTIGKMIEIIGKISIVNRDNEWQIYFLDSNGSEFIFIEKELVDALWNVVKERIK